MRDEQFFLRKQYKLVREIQGAGFNPDTIYNKAMDARPVAPADWPPGFVEHFKDRKFVKYPFFAVTRYGLSLNALPIFDAERERRVMNKFKMTDPSEARRLLHESTKWFPAAAPAPSVIEIEDPTWATRRLELLA